MCVCVCMYVQVDAGVYYNMCVEARGHPGVSVFTILPYLRQDLLFTAVYPGLASGDSPVPVYPRLASGDSPVPVSHLHTGIAEAYPAVAPFLHRFGISNLCDKNFAH